MLDDEYITITEAAEYLGVGYATMRNFSDKNILPTYKHPLTNRKLFKESDLKKLVTDMQPIYMATIK